MGLGVKGRYLMLMVNDKWLMVGKLKKLTNSKTHFPVHSPLSTNLRTQKLKNLLPLSTCLLKKNLLSAQFASKKSEVRES